MGDLNVVHGQRSRSVHEYTYIYIYKHMIYTITIHYILYIHLSLSIYIQRERERSGHKSITNCSRPAHERGHRPPRFRSLLGQDVSRQFIINIYIYIYTHVSIHVCTYMYIYIYTHRYIHILHTSGYPPPFNVANILWGPSPFQSCQHINDVSQPIRVTFALFNVAPAPPPGLHVPFINERLYLHRSDWYILVYTVYI